MELVPCTRCRRHVAVAETACPFCGTSMVVKHAQRFTQRGRLSRAAVFSAALVACDSKSDAPKPAPAPLQQGSDDLEKLLDTDRAVVERPALGDGGADGATAIATVSDAGVADAAVIEPDQQAIQRALDAERRRLQQKTKRKRDVYGDDDRRNTIEKTLPDRSPIPKPYGAPPARRRIV